MLKPDSNNYTHNESSANSENYGNLGNTFPEAGDYDVYFWANIWNVSDKTIREWVKEFNIPHWGPSDRNYFIDAVDFKAVFKKPKARRAGGKKT